MRIHEYTPLFQDTPEFHHNLNVSFENSVNDRPQLKAHRDYVQNKIHGFGERSFWWLWKLIMDELPDNTKLLEIGIFKGATVSLWRILKPDAYIFGVTPMDGTGLEWKDDDYYQHIKNIHNDFNQEMPVIFHGLSEDKKIIEEAKAYAPYGVVYIDGGHDRHHIDNDLEYYAPLVKQGGYLVIDDAACDMHQPFGYFQGITSVTDGVLDYMKENGDKWEFVINVVHLRVYQRK